MCCRPSYCRGLGDENKYQKINTDDTGLYIPGVAEPDAVAKEAVKPVFNLLGGGLLDVLELQKNSLTELPGS